MTWTLPDARQTVANRDGGACLVCGHRYEQIHHRYRRGMGGSKAAEINSPANLMALCADHHREAESLRTALSAPNGWCVPTLAHAFRVPVLTRIGWALLMDAGTMMPLAPGHTFRNADEAFQWAYAFGLIPA